jgi:crotonobetainyl-CoA:carnitine CoA-transferase CaiB-like acyl-CoA transferase
MVLDGIRVLDLTKVLAGPYCGMVLADLGAEVIKIETPGMGEDGRNTYPKRDDVLSAFFVAYNLGKKSITLNLKKEEALDAFYELVKTADVVMENMRTGTAERLGIGYEQLKKIKPDLIYCSISGYGRKGPYAKKGGYDIIAQAQFGMMAVTGNGRDDEPVRTAYSVNDVGTGLSGAFAIVCALIHRDRTGEGQWVEATLMNTQMAYAGHMATLFDVTKTDHKCHGMASFQLAPHQGYRASDGWVIIATSNEKQWDRICELPQFSHLKKDARFATMKLRVTNRAELTEIFENEFKSMTAKQVEEMFDALEIPVSKVNNMRDIYANPFFKSATMDDIPFEGHGTLAIPKTPMFFEKLKPAGRSAAPYLGQDNKNIFGKLGYSDDEIEIICG